MTSPDDLLIKRRRGPLRAAEEQQLEAAVRASRAYELSLHAGDAFDRAGAAAPDDAELTRALACNVERRWFSGVPSVRRRRRIAVLWIALPLAFAGAAAASYGSYRAFSGQSEPTVAPVPSPAHVPARAHLPAAQVRAAPSAVVPPRAPEPSEPPRSEPAAVVLLAPAPPAPKLTPHRSVRRAPLQADSEANAPEPEPRQPITSKQPVSSPLQSKPSESKPPEPKPPEPEPPASPRALFRRGQLLRQTDWPAAIAVYSQLIELYPDSTEASIAELALGKWALARGLNDEAITRFRAHRRRVGSALEAEALWGEARALDASGQRILARPLWQQLSERYPASPYATVARERLRD